MIGGDPDKDVAVLELQMPADKMADLKPVQLGSSANLQVGQKVFAIGNPFGLDHTLTQVTGPPHTSLRPARGYCSLRIYQTCYLPG